jgi:cytoskeleton protein RodZ
VPQERWSELAERLSMTHPAVECAAPRTGADLRAARERIGWSLPDFAAALHIRQQHLEALEGGRIADLPGTAYTLGFVRTYASALGLDPDEVARRFKAEAAAVSRHTTLDFPMPAPEHRVPPGAIALIGVLLAIGAYVGWYRLSGEGRLPAEAGIQVPARLAPLAEQAMPPHAAQPAPVVPPATPPATVQQAELPSAPSISPGSAAAAALPADPPHIVLRANADAWLQVRDRSGPVLLSRVLHAGETWTVPDRPNLLLTTGNAGGTDVLVDGLTTPSLGGNGTVRRDLPLDPDLIKTGKLAAVNTQPAGPRPNAQ